MTVYLTKSMLGRLNKVEYSNASFKYEPQAEDDHWQKLSLDSNIAYRLSNDMICRICAKGGCTPLTYKIYDNDIMGAIRSITNITISPEDALPKYICSECLESLKEAIKFKINCELSDKRFRELLNPSGYPTHTSYPYSKHDFQLILQKINAKRLEKQRKADELRKKMERGQQRKDAKTREFKCTFCDIIFPDKAKLSAHKREKNCMRRACDVCGQLVRSIAQHMRHTHKQDMLHRCPTCGKEFPVIARLKSHICLEDSGLKNMCRICCSENGKIPIFNNIKYPNMPEVITQFSGVDVCKNDNFPKHICHACLNLLNGCIKFKYICNLSHKRLSEICPKQETTKIVNVNVTPNETEESYNVPSPTFSDDNNQNWTCTTCYKEFQDLFTYDDHLSECMALDVYKEQNAEINKKTFLCDVCGKATTSNAHLLLHKTTHEHVFPHKCDQCPYRGKTVNLLRIHKNSHLNKPFKCTQCPKATSTSGNLARHMRIAHTTERLHKCTECDKAFFYKHALTKHVNEVHLRQGVVECDICFKIFNTKSTLREHTKKIHKIKSERQGRLPSYLHCTGETK